MCESSQVCFHFSHVIQNIVIQVQVCLRKSVLKSLSVLSVKQHTAHLLPIPYSLLQESHHFP